MNNPFIIAEIGINHNGDMDIAKQLIDMAIRCGADAVKFQKRTIDLYYIKDFLDSPRDSPWGKTQREQKEGLEFGKIEYDEIDKYCKGRIPWFASAFDIDALKFIAGYNPPYYKIPHQLCFMMEMLKSVASLRKLTFISIPSEDKNMVDYPVKYFEMQKCPFILLYCPAVYAQDKLFWGKYICEDEDLHFEVLKKWLDIYKTVGFSCHNYSILPPILAVALGAVAIEVHITLDRAMYGTDQACSFEEEGLRRIVRETRRIKEIMG